MSATEVALEQDLQARGLNAPRLTPDLIEAMIISETYVTIVEPDTNGNDAIVHDTKFLPGVYDVGTVYDSLKCLTICVLVLHNGFSIVGKSACASPANFNAEVGRTIARENARRQIWELEGYALKTRLAADAAASLAHQSFDR